MANWSTIETTLASWVTSLTGLTTTWAGRPRAPNFGDEGYLLLSIDNVRSPGHDDIITTYDDGADPGEEILTEQTGARTFTFGIQIRTWRQSAGADALHYASLIRDRVGLPALTGDVLAAADVAFARILGDTSVGTIQDGREMSVHQLDLLMNTTASTYDTPIGYIETVVDAELEIPEGSPAGVFDFDV